jgi:hypothetical protein
MGMVQVWLVVVLTAVVVAIVIEFLNTMHGGRH